MSESSENQNPPNEENQIPEQKWEWRPIAMRLLCLTKKGIRWIVDGLNYVSPLLTGLATVGIAWLAYWQLDVLGKTDQTMKDTLKANIVSQRPFVGMSGFVWRRIAGTTKWKISPRWENYGNTQTVNFTQGYYCFPVGFELAGDPGNLADPDHWIEMYPSYLGPKQNMVGAISSSKGTCDIEAAFLNEVQDKTRLPRSQLSIIAVARYQDTFDPDYIHETQYCGQLISLEGGKADSASEMRGTFTDCTWHNCSDEECKQGGNPLPRAGNMQRTPNRAIEPPPRADAPAPR